ncbi:MAG: aldehyde dehydrogenase family protein [Polyangiaceae bacterium]|nr:aldehyde dehydrogenase family protein [Polyangiaceae bacterium]
MSRKKEGSASSHQTQRSLERPLGSSETMIPGTPRIPESGGSDRVTVRKAYKLFIGGAFVRSESGRYTQVAESEKSPGGSLENIPWASRKDARDAVVGEAEHEVAAAIDRAIAFAGWTDKYQSLFASLNPTGGPHFTFTVPEPMGVVGIVAPSRPALLGLVGSILPVIVSGNSCVVLASEADPRTAITFAEAVATSDMPGGVVNILTGKVSEVLPHLAKHMEVAALDLHDVEAGLRKSVEEAAVANVKRVRARTMDLFEWYDPSRAESPRWIERFVEMKTIWHPAGM